MALFVGDAVASASHIQFSGGGPADGGLQRNPWGRMFSRHLGLIITKGSSKCYSENVLQLGNKVDGQSFPQQIINNEI